MATNPLILLEQFGQSIWLDYIRRDLITSGELRKMIENDGISGMTTNPAIFEKAISGNHDYEQEIGEMARQGYDSKTIYEAVCVKDVKIAADEFRPLFDRTDGNEGFVNIEVNPHLAHDALSTIEEARKLWTAIDRPNVMIKVPATPEALPAIVQLTCEGINTNVTLLFGLPRYQQVAQAYIAGIEKSMNIGKPLNHVASVASFFISRMASLVDPMEKILLARNSEQDYFTTYLKGQIAIATAQLAYEMYKEIFGSDRFRQLAINGARTQRLLWASTSSKNPEYSDVKYIEALIGENTVNAVPPRTLMAYREHGHPEARIELNLYQARSLMEELSVLGIDLNIITQELEAEGVKKICQQYDSLLSIL
jgi:transaldolase